MKLIKIDRLRYLSIGCAVIAAIVLIGEFSAGPKFDATFIVITMVILITALEEIRSELQELRHELRENKARAS